MINTRPLNQIEDNQYELFPIGEYEVEISGSAENRKDSDKPKHDVRFKILSGEHAGKVMFKTFSLLQEHDWAYKPFLLALGFDPKKAANFNAPDILGIKMKLTNFHKTDKGKTYNDPKNFVKVESGSSESADDDEIPF